MEQENKDLGQEGQAPEQNTESVEPQQAEQKTSEPSQTIKEIHHHHYGEKKRGFNLGRFFFGLLVLVIGLGLLASTMGWTSWNWFNFDWLRLWPIIIVIIGLSLLSFRGWIGAILGIIVAIVVVCFVGFLIFAQAGGSLVGSGNVIEQDRTVSGFDQIQLDGVGNIIVTQSSTEALKISAEDNIIPQIESTVEGNVLKLRYKNAWPLFSLRPGKSINFYVTVKDLKAVKLSGAGEINSNFIGGDNLDINLSGAGKANLTVAVKNMDTEISGAGQMVLAGMVDNLTSKISGAGKVDAKALMVSAADISSSGAGQATVNVKDNLKVRISGAGKVFYIGDPKLDEVITGAGDVEKINQ